MQSAKSHQQPTSILQAGEYAKLIVQKNDYGFKKSGCYIRNKEIRDSIKAPVSVPLKHIDYQVEIFNSIAKVVLQQTYTNPTSAYLELEYSVPVDPKVCIYKFQAVFGEFQIDGVVKVKEEANKEYDQAVSEGKKAAIGQLDKDSEDILNLKIGNVEPGQDVQLRIQYLYELDVSLNVFWRIVLQSKIWPRYVNEGWVVQAKQTIQPPPAYTWTFKVTLNTTERITFAQSTTHKLNNIIQNEAKTQIVFVMEEVEKPYKDFTFVYSTQNISKPTYAVSKTDTSQTLLMSFVPKFNDLQLSDAQRMQRQGTNCEVSISDCRGEFIFILDRSGSMDGSRIKGANNALTFFLKSLPTDSFFNVVSFGSRFSLMHNKSVATTTKSVDFAIEEIKQFTANFGGTEIIEPLQNILKQKPTKGYPKHIFLLTDGSVSNTNSVLQLIKQNSKYSTVHGIGIGNGCSMALIKGCSDCGKGKHILITDEQDPAEKIIDLLDQALSPAITDFELNYPKNDVLAVFPNPNEMPFILKNEPVSLYFLLNPGYQGEFLVNFNYTDPVTKKSEKVQIKAIVPSTPNFEFLDKKAQHKKLSLLCQALRDGKDPDLMFVKKGALKDFIARQSVKHQILCPETAFVCVQKRILDGKAQEIKDTGSVYIKVPQFLVEQQSQDVFVKAQKQRIITSIMPGGSATTTSSISNTFWSSNAMVKPSTTSIPQPRMQTTTTTPVPPPRTSAVTSIPTNSIKTPMMAPPPSMTYKSNEPIKKSANLQQLFGIPKQQKEENQQKQNYLFSLNEGEMEEGLDECIQIQTKSKMKKSQNVIKYKECEAPKKQMQKKKQSGDINSQLLSLQNADGSWGEKDSSRIIILLNIDASVFKGYLQKIKDSSFILTVLVSKYLQNEQDKKFVLILKKAKEWIKLKSKEYSPEVIADLIL